MHYIALTGSGILMVGCILPWASSGANSLDILLSGLALLGGLSAFGVAVYNIANGHERLKGAYPIIGAICLMIGVYAYFLPHGTGGNAEVRRQAGLDEELVEGARRSGSAIFFIAGGGILLIGAAVNARRVPGESVACLFRHYGRQERGSTEGAPIKTSLHVISGAFKGQVIPIPEEGIVFGRDPSRCNLILQSSDISRMHARLTPSMTGSGAILEDLSSTNGTFLWEEGAWTRLSVPANIVARGRFRLGDEKNEFEIC